MKNIYLLFCCCITLTTGFQPLSAQQNFSQTTVAQDTVNESFPTSEFPEPVFEFSFKKDLPILAGSGAMAVTGLLLMADTDPLTEAQVTSLDPNSVNAFDRRATRQYRAQDAHLSDYLLTLSALTPFTVLASRPVRREFGPVLVMYFETAALIGGLTSISKGAFRRTRPYAYNPNVPIEDRLSDDARHSFFSGHVSNSAAFCFLTAYMVNRYAERPGWKWAAWSGAVIIPGTIGVWRYTAGKHYPTDILTGFIMGAGTGILIPYLHKAQLPPEVSLDIYPTPYGVNLTLTF